MTEIISYHPNHRKEKQSLREALIDTVSSFHNLTKLSLVTAILLLIATPFFVNNQQSTRDFASTTPLVVEPTPAMALGIQAGQPIDDHGNILITDAVASRMAASGAKYVRVNFRLGPNTTDSPAFYSAYDTIVALLKSKGLQVIGLMSNESVPGSQANWTANNYEQAHGNGENGYITQFCLQFGRMAFHYQPQITYWEIWNEPNAYATQPSPGVFTGGTFIYPSNFAALLTDCHSQVHYYNNLPVQVISGGLFGHNISGYNSGSAGADYLDATYNVGINGTGKFAWAKTTYGSYPLDAVGQHIYVDQGTIVNQTGFTSYLDYVHNVITKYEGATSPKKTWMTEFGWTTQYVSEAVQSTNLQTALSLMGAKSYMAGAIWFQLDDNPPANFLYGIYHADTSKKLAWTPFNAYSQSVPQSPTPTPTPPTASIVGKTATGTTITAILNYYNNNGGQAANGTPFDNGGTAYAHYWDFGYVQDFKGGSIGQNSIFDTGHRVQTSFLTTYLTGNNHMLLKFPTDEAYGSGAGTRQDFQGGYMTWDAVNNVKVFVTAATPTPTPPVPTATPTPPVPTATPTPRPTATPTPPAPTPTPTPTSIVGKTATGTTITAILNYYNANGGQAANGTPFNNGGTVYAHYWDYGYVQDFNGGSVGQNTIFDTGHRVQTSFLTTYLTGNNHTILKFPTNDAYGYGSGTRQDFQGGHMTWDAVNGVKVVSP